MNRLRPEAAAALCLALWVPCALAATSEREISFVGAGGVKLSGTLALPPGTRNGSRFPAVVLVAGSGPTDRNGNQPPLLWTGLLKQLADALAGSGVASLRYDKRGVGRSGAAPKDIGALADFAAWDSFVGDVNAACGALRDQPEVDPSKVILIGHSEGGLLVMHAAIGLQEAEHPPAAVVLLCTPGRPTDVVIREQLVAMCKRLNLSEAGTKRLLERNDAITAAVREHGTVPPEVPPDLKPLYPPYIGRFYQGQLKTPPAELASRLTMPVLVMQGEKDLQVSAERDAPALAAALKARPGGLRSDLLIVANASHNLKVVRNDGEHAMWGPVVPRATFELTRWLGDVLRTGDRHP